ncbi:DNA methyltransferase [Thalassolituus sp.]|jgi:DNA modification methylase|uniref:DNA methyltransferase n=1 Tax=Thalassolituus sp. TaxID=2030822 RepID=UPI002A810003|nr:DNA methyltransferase [Thalassolituus sp.]
MTTNMMTPGKGLDLDNPNQQDKQDGPVECLGKTFSNDAERREYYLGILAEKLKDPEFRKIEGFPIGEDEAILELSDPPYYTACPNPFIEDFIAHYGRPYNPAESYKREPYAADVSEGKNDPIYNAHSYHTKVPHKAIMRYILHYTNPGDIVFDGFCGTGMTGVAAQMCGDRVEVESLGYRVLSNGDILENVDEGLSSSEWKKIAKLGERRVVLNDLSINAGFIAKGYNSLDKIKAKLDRIEILVNDAKEIFLNRYKTENPFTGETTEADFYVWSEVFSCPECTHQSSLFELAVDKNTYKLSTTFLCPSCKSELSKDKLDRVWVSSLMPDGKVVKELKSELVEVCGNFSDGKLRYKPLKDDLKNSEKVISDVIYWVPEVEFPHGRQTRKVKTGSGISYVCQIFTGRSLELFSYLWSVAGQDKDINSEMKFLLSSILNLVSKRERFRDGTGKGAQSGTLYVPSLQIEKNFFDVFLRKIKAMRKLKGITSSSNISLGSGSSSQLLIPDESLDYLFFDPPFGESLQYAELNYVNEAWHRVYTRIEDDCVLNYVHGKDLEFYFDLMKSAFKEAYRVIKPGRWITVEFSNSQASVWNSIQTALQDSGFVVANVSALDKKQMSFNSVTTTTSVKQDLVISAYKPNGGFEERFIREGDEEGVWDFVRTHLSYLPIVKKQLAELVKIPERDPRIIFDQLVVYFVRNLRDVPISSKAFQEGLLERFAERDGMIFLPEQVAEYDKARISSKQLKQLSIFVDDEASAIEWLRQLLNEKPQSYQDIHPKFINELSGWKKAEEQLELSKLLEQNFLNYGGVGQLPPQIHSYLSTNFKEMRNLAKDDQQLIKKAKDRWYAPNPEREEDLQKIRDRDLLKQFSEYKAHSGRKLKTVRLEAVRCGFKKAWQERDYTTIINVAEKIPQDLLQEDQKLLMWYDQAQTRASDESLF